MKTHRRTAMNDIRNFDQLYFMLCRDMETAPVVQTERWQGVKIGGNPLMAQKELTHVNIDLMLYGEQKELYAHDIGAELPWCDDHFEERVSGYPMNPGTEWMNWSGNKAHRDGARSFLDSRGKFNHNYMERYWPRFAGQVEEPTGSAQDWRRRFSDQNRGSPPTPNRGILYEYGQLIDVVDLLVQDPLTRQAYFPVWFPEDTGGGSKRAPCTIGYHFLMRNNQLDVHYYIRSCDLYKHFRNDVYLTVRLLLWVLDRARNRNPSWEQVKPGRFIMQIGSLHLFKPDWDKIKHD
jgi:hypothetical protein